MRRLTLTAFELEPGQQVMTIRGRDFLIPVTVEGIAWFQDAMVVNMGGISFRLDPNAEVDVVHPEQHPIYEMEDWHDD